jgi:hypothetical protein
MEPFNFGGFEQFLHKYHNLIAAQQVAAGDMAKAQRENTELRL